MSLTLVDEQYPTYILSDGLTGNYLKLVPSRGGIVTSWVVTGKEQFYMDQERFADPKLSIRGGNPILFPICGNLPDNTYTYDGKNYHLKQHGFARDAAWQVIGSSENSVTIELTSSDHTLISYPFAFQLQITYTLVQNRLEILQNITNHSQEIMPFAIGFHPYFLVRNKSSVSLDIPAKTMWNNVRQVEEDYSGSFDFDQPEVDNALMLNDQANYVVMQSDQGRLTVSFDPQYRVFVVWAIRGKDYICLEPWTAGRNAMNTGINLLRLAPQTSQSLRVTYMSEALAGS